MPKIEVHQQLFESLMGKSYTPQELEDILPVAKSELDDYDAQEKLYKLELNDTNRPDLWSAAGVARQLKSYESKTIAQYDFFSTAEKEQESGNRAVIVGPQAEVVRPYAIGFAVTGKVVDEEILLSLIQSQEKLCHNFGRKRKTIAIGAYRSDLITFPVHFDGVDPDTKRFVPLHMEEEMSLREIVARHPKGIEYGPIVADKPLYPLLFDDAGEVLSFPPVINSARLGAVEVGDENLYFDFSGTILDDLLLCAAIFACDCADLGFTILPSKVYFPQPTAYGAEITVPYYFQKEASCDVEFLRQSLGLPLSKEEITDALMRMGIESNVDEKHITIRVPEYRNDFLHPVDIVEDVMIGHGLHNFDPLLPKDSTIGRLTEAEIFARKAKDIMVGLGFQEMMYNYLGSKKEYIDNMSVDGSLYIQIANPMSENYEYVRPSIIPSLLESESVSAHAMYPHLIFEIGKVAFLDKEDISGATTRNYLGFLGASSEMGFNQLNSYLSTLFYYLNRSYVMEELIDDQRFIAGRCGHLVHNGVNVGVFGEIHPEVLKRWGITMPVAACEIDLDLLL